MGTYIELSVVNNDKDSKIKVGDHMRLSKFFCFLQKATLLIVYHVIHDLNGKEIVETVFEKGKTTNFRTEKVTRKKGDKLYLRWKIYDNLFNT